MMIFTQDQWLIVALVFVLGLLIGIFMTAGGRRKWKTRYKDEVPRREALERDHRDQVKHFESRENEWREQDSRRAAASTSTRRDADGDGVPNRVDDRPLDDRKA